MGVVDLSEPRSSLCGGIIVCIKPKAVWLSSASSSQGTWAQETSHLSLVYVLFPLQHPWGRFDPPTQDFQLWLREVLCNRFTKLWTAKPPALMYGVMEWGRGGVAICGGCLLAKLVCLEESLTCVKASMGLDSTTCTKRWTGGKYLKE